MTWEDDPRAHLYPAAWLQAIRKLRANPQQGAQLAAQARADVAQYSWQARAEAILSALSA